MNEIELTATLVENERSGEQIQFQILQVEINALFKKQLRLSQPWHSLHFIFREHYYII